MKADKLSFPLTLEAFVAYQEAGIGRKLGECERKVVAAWVPAFNDAYEDGKRLDYGAIKDSLDKMNSLVSSRETNPKLHRLLSVSRYWIAYAFSRGRADAGKVVGV